MPVSMIADLDAVALRSRRSAAGRPRLEGVHQTEVGIIVRERPVDRLQLCTGDHRSRRDRAERGAVQLDADGVQRDVELAGDLGARRVGPEPLLEVVALRAELRPIVLDRTRIEVDLLAVRGLRLFGRCQRITLQHDERAAGVDARGGSVWRANRPSESVVDARAHLHTDDPRAHRLSGGPLACHPLGGHHRRNE